MGSHFHDWFGYNGVAFSTELLEWGRTVFGFWDKKVLHLWLANIPEHICVIGEKKSVLHSI